ISEERRTGPSRDPDFDGYSRQLQLGQPGDAECADGSGTRYPQRDALRPFEFENKLCITDCKALAIRQPSLRVLRNESQLRAQSRFDPRKRVARQFGGACPWWRYSQCVLRAISKDAAMVDVGIGL